MKKLDYSHFLLTAGGRIHCRRCQATSRSGRQCLKAAVTGKKVCRSHGGASTGARTQAGIQKIRETHWVHGERSADSMERDRFTAIRLRKLSDALNVLGVMQGSKMSGRWPDGYQPLETMDDVRRFAAEIIEEIRE